jgi:hypothetical protein
VLKSEGLMHGSFSVSVRATHLAVDLVICRRCSDERRAVVADEMAES